MSDDIRKEGTHDTREPAAESPTEPTAATSPETSPANPPFTSLFEDWRRSPPALIVNDPDVYHAWLRLGLDAGWVHEVIGTEHMWNREAQRPTYGLMLDNNGIADLVRHAVMSRAHDQTMLMLARDLGMETRAHPLLKLLYGETYLSPSFEMRQTIFPEEMVAAMAREMSPELQELLQDPPAREERMFDKLRQHLPPDSPLHALIDEEQARLDNLFSSTSFADIFAKLKEHGSPYRNEEVGDGTPLDAVQPLDPPAKQSPMFGKLPDPTGPQNTPRPRRSGRKR